MLASLLAAVLHIGSIAANECPLQEKAQAASYASAALSERAHTLHVQEADAGTMLLLWRGEACELASKNARLLQSTQKALDDECLQVVPLDAGTEKEYLEAAKEAAIKRQPTLLALAWTTKAPQRVLIVIITDGASGMRFEHAEATKESSSRCTPAPLGW